MAKATPEAREARIVTHERARQAASRFIDGWFKNQGREYPRASIPVDTDDDDVILMDYIRQQEGAQSAEQKDEHSLHSR